MIKNKHLAYCTTLSGVDFYEYKVKLFSYFYTPMAYYENLFSRKIRETIDFLRGNYHVYYIAKDNNLIGYGTVVKGGGRYRFSSAKDIILCNFGIQPQYRGRGYSSILYQGLLEKMDLKYEKAFAFITHDNTPSIKSAQKNGFVKTANASRKGIVNFIVVDPNGYLGIYQK